MSPKRVEETAQVQMIHKSSSVVEVRMDLEHREGDSFLNWIRCLIVTNQP